MKSTGKVDRIRAWPKPTRRRRFRTLQQKLDGFQEFTGTHRGHPVTFPSLCDIEILEHPAVRGILFCPDGKCRDPKIILMRDDTISKAVPAIQAIYNRYHPGLPELDMGRKMW